MKRILSLIALLFISYVSYSQTKGISYQAVIIDPNPIQIPGTDITAQPYVSKDVWIRFGIYSGTTLQYEELHKTKTDEYGLVNLIIGAGVNTGRAGTFTSLSWDGITKNILTNVSFDQGGRYFEVSNQKLTYVPYTFLAETAVKLAGVLPVNQGGTGATNAIAARTNLGLGNVDNTADVDKPVSTATLAILDVKESLANKSTNIIADSASSVKYPSVKAIKDYIDSRNSASANSARLAAKATALETPRTINGVPFDGTTNITIPVGVTPPDADANTKGLVRLAGDLTGTAAAPAIAANSVTTPKIIDGAVTDAKITSVSGSKVTGNIAGNAATATKLAAPKNINGVPFDGSSDITISASAATLSGTIAIANGGTGATTAAGARTNLGLVIGTDVLAQRTFGTAANSAATDFIAATEKGANNGVATLGVNGKIPSVQIPSISFQSVSVVNSDAAMTAISGAQVGSIAIRSDQNINYVLSALPATTLSNWIQLAASTDVSVINGIVGPSVNLTTNEIPEGNTNKYFTDARVRNALSAVAPLNFNASTGVLSMTAASASSNGYLSSADWTTFNNKQTALTAGVDYVTPSGNITGNAANVTGIVSIANGGTGTSTATGALITLGAEPSSNKSNDILVDGNSTTKFPSFKAIKDYVDQQSANAGVADNSITSAKIFGTLAVLKGGTGASTPAGARTNLGLVIGTDVMAANFTTTLTGDVTGSGNGSFATTVNSVGGVSAATISTLPTSVSANTASITANTSAIAANTTSITANTAAILLKASIASPTFTGTPSAPTPAISDNSTTLATTEYVKSNLATVSAGTLTGTTLASTITGSSLTSVGTITSGVWSATEIAIAKGGTGATTAAGARANLGLIIGADVQAPLVSGTDYIAPNASITGATKTKITYDSKGLVTAGTDATTADIAPSLNRNYVTDAQAGVISNTSGVNTGDQTITLTGDVTGSGTGSFATTLTDSGVSSGTYGSSTAIPVLTVDSKGRLTSASTVGIIAGVNTLNYTSTTSYAAGGTISGTTLTLAAANATNPGLISTGTQTFVGSKTFSNTITFNTDAYVNGLTLGKGRNSNSGNVAFGTSPLSNTTTGTHNTAVGNMAQGFNTSGSHNTGLGHFALYYNTTGTNNTAIGSNAFSEMQIGSNNVAIGFNAGKFFNATSPLTNVNNSIYIGTNTKAGVNTSTNEVVIGHETLGNGSNTVTIGNSSTTNNYFRGNLNLTGNVSGGTWSGTTIGSNYGGAGSVNGILKANGSGVVSAAVAGTDFMAANATTTLTGDVTGSGNGSFATTVNSVGGVSSSTISTLPTTVASNTASITANTNEIALRATIASPSFTGTPTAPTPTAGDNSTKIATTEYVQASITAASAGISSVGPISATANANGATISNSSQLILTPASASFGGVVTTAAQTFAGAKTFSETTTFNSDITVNGIKIGLGNTGVTTNTGVGSGTLSSVTSTGTDLTALGYFALSRNTTGASNTAIGRTALLANTTGANNTAIGRSALESNTTGVSNFAGGMDALKGNSSGQFNTAVGGASLTSNTSGERNTAVGYWALRHLAGFTSTSSNNTAIGAEAGRYFGSGTSTLSSSTKGVFLGSNTRPSADLTINEVVIGADAIGNGSNTVTVGNLSNTATFFTGNINLTGNVVGGTWSGSVIGSNYGGAGTVNGLLKANGSGVVSAAISGTDFQAPLTAGSGISIASGTISATGLTSANLSSTAGITNSQLANSSTILGLTTMTLGGTVTSVTGLTSLAATNLTGTLSGTATSLATGRTIALTGDVTYTSPAFDGSGDVTAAATLAASGVVSGTYGSSTAIPVLTVDTKGRVTSASTVGIIAGVNSLNYTSTTSYSAGGTISGTSLTLAAADGTNPGLISTGAQTIAGAKTFSADVTAPNFLGNATTATTASNITATTNTTLTSLANLATVGTITSGTWSATEVAIAKGGTGATTAADARTNLGLGSLATKSTIANADVASGAAIDFAKLNITKANITSLGIQDGLTAGSGISLSSGTISVTGLTSANLSSSAGITNAQLTNSSIQLGSTTMTLGGTVTSVTGLTSLASTTLIGTLSGTASTANTLTTSRAINGVAFNGSADITIAANSNTLTGTILASNVVSSSLTGVATITSGTWNGSTIGVGFGGTGLTSPGTSGNLLTSNGTSWVSSPLSAVTTLGTFTTTSYANGGTISGTTLTLSAANATNSGLLTAGTQTIGGAKTFSNTTTFSTDILVNNLTVGRGNNGVLSNTAVGNGALKYNETTGSNNTSIGYESLFNNTSGDENTAIGSGAMDGNSTGSFNTAIGSKSMNLNEITGNRNQSIGYNSLYKVSSGYENTALGAEALYENTIGYQNVAIGNKSILGLANRAITGNNNVGVGYASLTQISSGNNNIGIGASSLGFVAGGNNNIAIGFNAGTRFGSGQSTNSATSISNNIFIGYDVRPMGDNDNNQIIISNSPDAANLGNGQIGLGSHTTLIGNSATQRTQIHGALTVVPNAATSGAGNSSTIAAQNGFTNSNGGALNLNAGNGNGTGIGGNVVLTPGTGATAGQVQLAGATIITGAATISNSTTSNNTTSGALVVTGGTGIGGNANIGGTLGVTGATTLTGAATISNTTTSSTSATGALIVRGGVGVGENLNIGGTLGVTGATTLVGAATISNTSNSNSTTSGALVVRGGVGMAGNLTVGGTIEIDGGSPAAGKVLSSDANGVGSWTYAVGSTVVTSTSSYAITLSEAYVFYTGTSTGAFTIPAAAAGNAGKTIVIKNKTAFGITVTPASGTIYIDSANSGAANVSIGIEASNNWIKLVSDGTQWNVFRALF